MTVSGGARDGKKVVISPARFSSPPDHDIFSPENWGEGPYPSLYSPNQPLVLRQIFTERRPSTGSSRLLIPNGMNLWELRVFWQELPPK
jgi:hypothetical protein